VYGVREAEASGSSRDALKKSIKEKPDKVMFTLVLFVLGENGSGAFHWNIQG